MCSGIVHCKRLVFHVVTGEIWVTSRSLVDSKFLQVVEPHELQRVGVR